MGAAVSTRLQFALCLGLQLAGLLVPVVVAVAGQDPVPHDVLIPNAPLQVQARPVVTPVAVLGELDR
jgi:hypothetical protein